MREHVYRSIDTSAEAVTNWLNGISSEAVRNSFRAQRAAISSEVIAANDDIKQEWLNEVEKLHNLLSREPGNIGRQNLKRDIQYRVEEALLYIPQNKSPTEVAYLEHAIGQARSKQYSWVQIRKNNKNSHIVTNEADPLIIESEAHLSIAEDDSKDYDTRLQNATRAYELDDGKLTAAEAQNYEPNPLCSLQ